MHLNSIKPAAGSRKKAVRVGRGSGSGLGKTCGKGQKGQTSRGKGKVAIGFEGGQMPKHRRVPKSGFVSRKSSSRAEIRLSDLARIDVDVVDLQALWALNIVNRNIKEVKVIASGVLEKAITVRGLLVTGGAKEAIELAGGQVN